MRSPKTPNYILRLIFIILGVATLAMVMMNELSLFFLLLLLLFLMLFLWGLTGGDEEKAAEGTPRNLERPKYPPEAFYIQDQIIVRGPATAVNAIIGRFSEIVNPEPLQSIPFEGLEGELKKCIGHCTDINFEEFVINLYRLAGTNQDVADTIQAINDAAENDGNVQAEPNWITGHPWEPTGSPWEPTGSPWEPTGSLATSDKIAAPGEFEKQWAFRQINLPNSADYNCGDGVTIGIFDTSPFDGHAAVGAPNVTLNNSYAHLLPPENNTGSDLSSHGVFVASLAEKIAPNVNIEMIRVLNKHNEGSVYALLLAIYEFTLRHNRFNPANPDSIGAVMNMSLGIRILTEEVEKPLPSEVQALRILLQLAKCAGIMVVAAAGNDSANKPGPEAANLPANWPEIFGVAASNKADGRSCFSNWGNIGAPGGDGTYNEEDCLECGPAKDPCQDGECAHAVIGRIYEPGQGDIYAYWSGSSFAAPMVAGLAACVIHLGQGKLSPAEVRAIIECGADTKGVSSEVGGRRINVAQTLNLRSDCWNGYRDRLVIEEPASDPEYRPTKGETDSKAS